MPSPAPHIVVIGAGIGGLACALRLSGTGARVTVLERHGAAGGKMRSVQSSAGPIDAGPTVLTMKHVFDTLFASVGARLDDHITMTREAMLARHFWTDGTMLDLMHDRDQSAANIHKAFGATSASDFSRFADKAARLFNAFEDPVMQSATPTVGQMTAKVLGNPRLIPAMAPHKSLARSLRQQFSDPRIAQLFARYATYVGGIPALSPALLSLIAHAESNGVWHVKGGMHQLARAIETRAASLGATFHYNAHVDRIETANGSATAVYYAGTRISCDAVVFNGDPNAIADDKLGAEVTTAVPPQHPRSLSAYVATFAATPNGLPLAAHNVLFADNPATEYAPLARGKMQTDPTLYICAQDRFGYQAPQGAERFEIILNAPPNDTTETQRCITLITRRLHSFGLNFSPAITTLTTPRDFGQMFPASHGSLYGRSPHGMMAAFKRPTARTKIKGLYLVGGGVHPGAGVPMAALSGQHAVAAIMQDLHLTSMSPQAATHGGMSTA
ncbi:MAG: phytoene desaturase family protein [Yoonia sp.]|nr:phytoene desaturase family protein [Yoonia sp.]MDG1862297.1 phytoene desaturase family protein [Yoonia sp.]